MAVNLMRHSSIARDHGGVEGLPMTLLVTAVILAITVPLVFGSFRAYDAGRAEAQLAAELDNFISGVQLVYMSGPGNSALIPFDVRGGSMASVDYVAFGGEADGNLTSTVRYCMSGGRERIMAITSPNVPMFSQDDSELRISSGQHTIIAECVLDRDGNAGVLLSLLS